MEIHGLFTERTRITLRAVSHSTVVPIRAVRRAARCVYMRVLPLFATVRSGVYLEKIRRREAALGVRANRPEAAELERLLEESGYADSNPFPESLSFACEEDACDLSLIVPAFNAEDSIRDCVDSILKQKTSYSYELILVNDGSMDATLDILREYERDERVVIVSQPNGGISRARNAGLRLAGGGYVGFVDADDVVCPEYIETLMRAACEKEVDYVKCGHTTVLSDGALVDDVNMATDSVEEMRWRRPRYNGFIWGSVMRRSLWDGVGFPAGYWYEDMITRSLVYRMCESYAYIDKPLYIKRYRNASSYRVMLKKKGSPKSLDQVFLFKHIVEKGRDLGLRDDAYLLSVAAAECGKLMMARVGERYQPLAFLAAAGIVQDIIGGLEDVDETLGRLDEAETHYVRAFRACDFELWRLACEFDRWQTARFRGGAPGGEGKRQGEK